MKEHTLGKPKRYLKHLSKSTLHFLCDIKFICLISCLFKRNWREAFTELCDSVKNIPRVQIFTNKMEHKGQGMFHIDIKYGLAVSWVTPM